MRRISFFSPMLLLFPMLACTSGKERVFMSADSPEITYMGRTLAKPSGAKAFNFPGVAAMFDFTGDSLSMAASPGSGYFMVEIDTIKPFKINFADGDSVMVLAKGLGEGVHSARVTYAIEGYEKNPEIRGFGLADEGKLIKVNRDNKPKIEFIGNSITCGYGTEAPDAQTKFSYDTENHCLSYAYLTARTLDADVNVVARSGIGVYRNYDGPKEGSPEGTMPMEYTHTLLYDDSQPWDFASFRPDVICINLGTNDLSTNNYDIEAFEKAYSEFLDRVMSLNPGSKVVLLTGSMLNGKELELAKSVLDRLASQRKDVFRFDMTPETGELGYGADYHPSAARAQKMAEELTAFLKTLL